MKNILIDTQILIWISEKKSNIKSSWLKEIYDMENQIFVSIVSFWEIAIKTNIGKLKMAISLDLLFDFTQKANIQILDISPAHIKKLANLEFFHNDPFDRMIIIQAITENLQVISSDGQFQKYQIDLI